jgi:hypothetical protein
VGFHHRTPKQGGGRGSGRRGGGARQRTEKERAPEKKKTTSGKEKKQGGDLRGDRASGGASGTPAHHSHSHPQVASPRNRKHGPIKGIRHLPSLFVSSSPCLFLLSSVVVLGFRWRVFLFSSLWRCVLRAVLSPSLFCWSSCGSVDLACVAHKGATVGSKVWNQRRSSGESVLIPEEGRRKRERETTTRKKKRRALSRSRSSLSITRRASFSVGDVSGVIINVRIAVSSRLRRSE